MPSSLRMRWPSRSSARVTRRLDAVIDAPHARGVAHAARDREAGDVVGDGDDQVLPRRDQVVDDARRTG